MRRSTTTSTTRKQSPSATSTYTAHVSAGATTVASSASSGTKRSLENRLPSTATARRREISSTSTTSSRPTCLLAANRAYRGSVQHRPWGTDEHRRARRDDMRRCRHRLEVTYTDPRPGDIDESVADISKARSELGFEPTVSLREGLKTTVAVQRLGPRLLQCRRFSEPEPGAIS